MSPWPLSRAFGRIGGALVLAISLLSSAMTPARAYVRTTTDKGVPVRWTQSCVPMLPDQVPPPTLSLDDTVQTLTAAVGNWNRPTSPCSAISLFSRPAAPRKARLDGLNVIVFLSDTWGRDKQEYDPSVAAITTVSYVSQPGSPLDGTISDADIELNAVDFYFARVDPDHVTEPADLNGRLLSDLENTLTHELGHVLGLGHTCWDHLTDQPPKDDTGHPIPDCDADQLPASITSATMFPYSIAGETSKRQITQDEVRGVCVPYPNNPPSTAGSPALFPCESTVYGGYGGCQASGGGGRGRPPASAVLLGLLLCVHFLRRATGGRAGGRRPRCLRAAWRWSSGPPRRGPG